MFNFCEPVFELVIGHAEVAQHFFENGLSEYQPGAEPRSEKQGISGDLIPLREVPFTERAHQQVGPDVEVKFASYLLEVLD